MLPPGLDKITLMKLLHSGHQEIIKGELHERDGVYVLVSICASIKLYYMCQLGPICGKVTLNKYIEICQSYYMSLYLIISLIQFQ